MLNEILFFRPSQWQRSSFNWTTKYSDSTVKGYYKDF